MANVPERGKIKIAPVQAAMEKDLVYPLLRGRDVSQWAAEPVLSILLTHKKGMRLTAIKENQMQAEYPKAWRYLSKYRATLTKSGLFKRFCKATDPFYSMFNIGDYTFAGYKLVIREIAGSLTCAVIGKRNSKPVIPDHKLVLVDTETAAEAHYLCAVLSSSAARLFVGSYCIETQFSAHIFRMLKVDRFDPAKEAHRNLAELSEEAHRSRAKGDDEAIAKIAVEIDALTAQLWELKEADAASIRTAAQGL